MQNWNPFSEEHNKWPEDFQNLRIMAGSYFRSQRENPYDGQRFRNWVFKMKSTDDLLSFRGLLMRALTQGCFCNLEGEQEGIGLMHLHNHRTKQAMINEYGSAVEWIKPLKKSCHPLKAFKAEFPNYQEVMHHGFFPREHSHPVFMPKAGLSSNHKLVDYQSAMEREVVRLMDKRKPISKRVLMADQESELDAIKAGLIQDEAPVPDEDILQVIEAQKKAIELNEYLEAKDMIKVKAVNATALSWNALRNTHHYTIYY